MSNYKAYKTELRPNQKQIVHFRQSCGVARFVYNWALEHRIKYYEETGKTFSEFDQVKFFNSIKKEQYPWVYEVSKWCASNAIKNCDRAYKNFFRTKIGFPKFKSKHGSKASYTIHSNGSPFQVEKDKVKLPKIGWIRLKEKGYLPTDSKVNSATISERAGRWFISVQVEEELSVFENQGTPIGLDLGLKHFVTGSDGAKLESPYPLRRSLKKSQRLSRQLSRKVKGSKNREKARAKLAKLHYKISCQRNDFIHKTSHRFATQHSVVCTESLAVKEMLGNKRFSRSISDVGWGEFTRQLAYKCEWYGSKLEKVDRYFPSSKMCSSCGFVLDKLSLSVREWTCPACQSEHDRDINAAKNILKQGTVGYTGIYACGEKVLTEVGSIS